MHTAASIEQLERRRWGPPPADASRLVQRCHALRQQPIDHLDSEDLRLLLGQEIGVACILPRAVAILQADLLAEGDLYPGDLLLSVLHLSSAHWAAQPDLKRALQTSLLAGRGDVERAPVSAELRHKLMDAIAQFLGGAETRGH